MSQDRGRSHITVEQLLADARARLDRLAPERAQAAVNAGRLLIDIRSELQRERDGVIPGSRFIARNVLEWRCDPASPWRDRAITDAGTGPILICDEGYQSSLAAATLQRFGLDGATDVIGGFQAWKAAGLPLQQAQTASDAVRSVIGPRRPPDEGDERPLGERPASHAERAAMNRKEGNL
jgi:rhodanese-related sulfurtransferase